MPINDTKVQLVRKYWGLAIDEYTPEVESQILRDCIALQKAAYGKVDEFVIVSTEDRMDPVLSALGLRRVPLVHLAKDWIVYKVGDNYPDLPESATGYITQRDLEVHKSPTRLRVNDEATSNGYYLPPQGRPSPDTINLNKPTPNGYVPTDPALIMMWG